MNESFCNNKNVLNKNVMHYVSLNATINFHRTGAAGSSSEAGPSTHMPDNLADLPKEKLGKLVKQLSNELIGKSDLPSRRF